MDRIHSNEMNYWRNFFTRSAIIVVTVALIVWFMPREEGKQFRYGIDKPWTYGPVIAKFDFPIYKTDEVIKHEQDSLLNTLQPYYKYDETIEKEMIEKFLTDFQNGLPGLPSSYKNLIFSQLHNLYQAGIMNTPDFNRLAKDTTSMVKIITGKQAQSMPVISFYSTLSAYEQLFQDPRLETQRQALQRCNLNEYIEPNLIYDKERSETERTDVLSGIAIASGMVLAGQKIIDRGDIVNAHTFQVLESFEREMKRRSATASEITSTTIGHHRPDHLRGDYDAALHALPRSVPPRLLRQAAIHHDALLAHHDLPDCRIYYGSAQFPEHLYPAVCHGADVHSRVHGLSNGLYRACHYGSYLRRRREISV